MCHLLDIAGDVEHDGDGPQGVGHAAHSRRLLPDQPVAVPQVFVGLSSRHPSHPDLGQHVIGVADGVSPIGGEVDREAGAPGRCHPPGEAADHRQAVRIGVGEPQLAERVVLGALDETGHEFRCIGGSSADDGDLEHDVTPRRLRVRDRPDEPPRGLLIAQLSTSAAQRRFPRVITPSAIAGVPSSHNVSNHT